MKNSKGFESLPNLQEAPPSQPMPNSENRVNVHVEPGSKEGFGIVCGTSPSGIEKLLVQIKVHVYSGSGSFPKKGLTTISGQPAADTANGALAIRRMPQSVQSEPRSHWENSDPGPPSEHLKSADSPHESVHR